MEENKLIAHALRFIVRDIEKYPVFASIPKEIVYQLRYGENRDKSELVYKADRTKKTKKEWEKAVRRTAVEPDHLVYNGWYGATLLGGLLKPANSCNRSQRGHRNTSPMIRREG